MVWAIADFPKPAVPWRQNNRGALSSTLLIQSVISSRISPRVPSKQSFWVLRPAPSAYSILLRYESSAITRRGHESAAGMIRKRTHAILQDDPKSDAQLPTYLLHKFVENAAKLFHAVIRPRQQVLDKSRPLTG